jgi:N-carbamoyl-L-amino-acid hydrolase
MESIDLLRGIAIVIMAIDHVGGYFHADKFFFDATDLTKTNAAKNLGYSYKTMPGGAGHDAREMAQIAPAGMVFIPSVGGICHSPKEFSKPSDMANGANVLLQTILMPDKE